MNGRALVTACKQRKKIMNGGAYVTACKLKKKFINGGTLVTAYNKKKIFFLFFINGGALVTTWNLRKNFMNGGALVAACKLRKKSLNGGGIGVENNTWPTVDFTVFNIKKKEKYVKGREFCKIKKIGSFYPHFGIEIDRTLFEKNQPILES